MYFHSGVLELGEFTRVKAWDVARNVGMDKRTVLRAIKVLVSRGYIREGPKQEHGIRSYRLLASRRPEDHQQAA